MSEKLSRCRKKLAAAIDRAMEDLSAPLPDSTSDQDLPVAQLSTSAHEDLLNDKGETEPHNLYCPQPSAPASPVPEKENPLFRPNLIPVTVTSSIPCPKREPLTSKENTWLCSPILVTDRQFFVSLEDSERRKGHLSKTDETSMKSETSVTASDASPRSLAGESDSPAIWPAERKFVLENDLQEMSQLSSTQFSLDESLILNLDVGSFRKVLEHSPEDEAIIETLLDMEEEYRQTAPTCTSHT